MEGVSTAMRPVNSADSWFAVCVVWDVFSEAPSVAPIIPRRDSLIGMQFPQSESSFLGFDFQSVPTLVLVVFSIYPGVSGGN